MSKMLNIGFAIEVLNGRLNGSSSQVEKSNGFGNTTFTKKINGKGSVSASCQKYNMINYLCDSLNENRVIKHKAGDGAKQKILINPDPFNNSIDDIFGFMMADKTTSEVIYEKKDNKGKNQDLYNNLEQQISEASYNKLDTKIQKCYKKVNLKNEKSGTRKRKSRLQMNSLISVKNGVIKQDFGVCDTLDGFGLYNTEVYSSIMYNIANLHLDEIGKFNATNDNNEFRDYFNNSDIHDLSKEDRVDRITKVLKAIETLSISGNQTNQLTDTKPKFVIMGEYSWGNNVFQGIIKKDGIDIDMLKESLEQNEEYRLSPIYIGINKFFDDEYYNNLLKLKDEFKNYDYVHIDNIHNTFNNYIEYMKETLE